jgi:hypothetical protein
MEQKCLQLCDLPVYILLRNIENFDICILEYVTVAHVYEHLNILCIVVERVRIVWSPTRGVKRFRSPVYIICFVTVALYSIIIALMVGGKVLTLSTVTHTE